MNLPIELGKLEIELSAKISAEVKWRSFQTVGGDFELIGHRSLENNLLLSNLETMYIYKILEGTAQVSCDWLRGKLKLFKVKQTFVIFFVCLAFVCSLFTWDHFTE